MQKRNFNISRFLPTLGSILICPCDVLDPDFGQGEQFLNADPKTHEIESARSGFHCFQDEKLTDTGDPGVFFNGVADWVFEEEVLEDDRALWWAPDGNSLVC